MTRRHVNLGCGSDYRKSTDEIEWINVEKNQKLKADIHTDLEDCTIAINANSCDYVLLKHVLEHITNLIPLMDEVYRIMKPDAILEVHVPYWTHKWAWGDPTHVRCFMENSFVFWDKEEIVRQVKLGMPTSQLDCKANFKTLEIKPLLDIGIKDKFDNKSEELAFAIEHNLNIVAEIQVKLQAIKNGSTKT